MLALLAVSRTRLPNGYLGPLVSLGRERFRSIQRGEIMAQYVSRRLAISILLIWLVISVSFFLIRLMPGNAMTYMYEQMLNEHLGTAQQIMQRLQVIYGFNPKTPEITQYFSYLGQILRGRFGTSTLYPGTPVIRIIADALPWTILSVAISVLISFTLGVALGVVMAYFRRSAIASGLTWLVTVLHSIPNYIYALIGLYFLVDLDHVLPSGGAYGVSVRPGLTLPFLGSVALHLALPVGAYVVSTLGGWALGMKSTTVGVLGAEYITAAKARGIRESRIVRTYVARNALLPQITGLGLTIGFMFGGSVFIETMFNYPGIGYYLITAVNGRDYTLMMGIFILTTSAIILANLVTDLIYPRFDPRVKVSERAEEG